MFVLVLVFFFPFCWSLCFFRGFRVLSLVGEIL